ncbi:hypothetical protein CEXT_489541 [Caerostris extrusa]|uniref:Uncharacterized protein n=1 Tax=Caerostris extrusa TaxID=172846 RepID=A0AAV4TER5_CAEEX|nr:hypothetical protein CEXT_489541 [Caerostris extrusa]
MPFSFEKVVGKYHHGMQSSLLSSVATEASMMARASYPMTKVDVSTGATTSLRRVSQLQLKQRSRSGDRRRRSPCRPAGCGTCRCPGTRPPSRSDTRPRRCTASGPRVPTETLGAAASKVDGLKDQFLEGLNHRSPRGLIPTYHGWITNGLMSCCYRISGLDIPGRACSVVANGSCFLVTFTHAHCTSSTILIIRHVFPST